METKKVSQREQRERLRERRKSLLYTNTAAEALDLSPAQFRKLATRLEISPEAHTRGNHGGAFLWSPEQIESLKGSLA